MSLNDVFSARKEPTATSFAELREIRDFGLQQQVAVIPNGVDCERFCPGETPTRRRVLFLSRIHPNKGIDLLLSAWRELAPEFPDADLLLAGPGEPEHVRDLYSHLAAGDLPRANYRGPIPSSETPRVLREAWVVVLPSLSESYGMVVAEALASGTPVVTTTATPWPDLPGLGCGWWIEPKTDAIRDALHEALSIKQLDRRPIGEAAVRFARERHSLHVAAEAMERSYLWLAGKGERPEFVQGVEPVL